MKTALSFLVLLVGIATASLAQESNQFKFEAFQRHQEQGINFQFLGQEKNFVTSDTAAKSDSISFHYLSVSSGDAPKTDDKLMQRQANRVLVFYSSKSIPEMRLTQICPGRGRPCEWVQQPTGRLIHDNRDSMRLVESLKKHEDGASSWKCGTGKDDHFKFVDISDESNKELVKSLKIQSSDLPMLVKEKNDVYRKKARGMSAKDAFEWWNKVFKEVKPDGTTKDDKPMCTPGVVGGFLQGPNWDYHGEGSLRDHLSDMKAPHHLPKAVVDQMTDKEVQEWHNWHHEVLRGAISVQRPAKSAPASQPQASTGAQRVWQMAAPRLGYRQGSREEQIAQRITQIVSQTIKSGPPPSMMAKAGSSKKKQDRILKEWKEDERRRIRKEVNRKIWNEYATMDPFSWLMIIKIIWTVLSILFQLYDLY